MEIPKIGLGTWDLRDAEGQKAIETALEIGYRHIDTADWYRNHDIVASAMKASGVPRTEVYLVTKIYPPFSTDKILRDGHRFLAELDTEYIDLLLVHWPDNNPIKDTLEAFAQLKREGVAKEIGVSNFSLPFLKQSIDFGFDIYNHQIEVYPGNFDKEMINFCKEKGVFITAYSPLNRGKGMGDPLIVSKSQELGITTAQLILAWLLREGLIVIPKASSREHMIENLEAGEIGLPEDVDLS